MFAEAGTSLLELPLVRARTGTASSCSTKAQAQVRSFFTEPIFEIQCMNFCVIFRRENE